MSKLRELQDRLGYGFRDESLLRLALTHPSVAHESPATTSHNQRLEFLGDAVLGLVVCDELYQRYSDWNEGDLTKVKSVVVSRRASTRRVGPPTATVSLPLCTRTACAPNMRR